jgi:hypothetical protein
MVGWIMLVLTLSAMSQAPQKFNYQSVVRDGDGNTIANQNVGIRISILQGSIEGPAVYTEAHSATTNAFGLVTLEIESGTVESGDLSSIDWGVNEYFLKVELDPTGGTSYQDMGTTQLLSVPYALYAHAIDTPMNKLGIVENSLSNPDEALFEVKTKEGETVFAVYNEGVRVYVREDAGKGTKGGFAIGGFIPSKGMTNEYMRVTPDSVRIYIDDTEANEAKAGFAVGQFNAAIGYESGLNINAGSSNAFLGYQSGYQNNTGTGNLFLGYQTGFTNTDGNYNSFLGYPGRLFQCIWCI